MPSRRPPTPLHELIVVDHHASNTRYGTINVIDPDAAASGVIVRRLVQEARLPLDGAVGVLAILALVCDTGRFQYDPAPPAVTTISAQAHRVRRSGVSPVAPSSSRKAPLSISSCSPRPSTMPCAAAERQFVWTFVTQEMLARHGVTLEEIERSHRHPAPHHRGRGHVRRQGKPEVMSGEPAFARCGRRGCDRRGPRQWRPSVRSGFRPLAGSRRAHRVSATPSDRLEPVEPTRKMGSSSSTSRRDGRRTTSSPNSARPMTSAVWGMRERSIPTRPACCSSVSVERLGCCAFSREAGKSYRGGGSCSGSRPAPCGVEVRLSSNSPCRWRAPTWKLPILPLRGELEHRRW